MIRLFILLTVLLPRTRGLFIDGCPLFGCRPSGAFSFYMDVPKSNATINWISNFHLDPVPNALGCVSDSVSIICQSNGVFSNEKGYVSLYGDNGTIRWRDTILENPTLPILDNYGDVSGSDGVSLVHYDMDGKKYPIINCQGMQPIFSMQLVGTTFLLMVSEQGCLSVRDTNAIPDASIFLNATIDNTKGCFLPVSQPVVNGQRFYLLTEFFPDTNAIKANPSIKGRQRLYAIDIHHRLADIMTIAWFYDFMDVKGSSGGDFESILTSDASENIGIINTKEIMRNIKDKLAERQVLMWEYASNTVFVSLPMPTSLASDANDIPTFWGLEDLGNSSSVLFKSGLNVTHMATFEANDGDIGLNTEIKVTQHANISSIWITTTDGSLCHVLSDGTITKTIHLRDMLHAYVTITSKLSLTRQTDTAGDILIMAVKVLKKYEGFLELIQRFSDSSLENTAYVLAIDPNLGNGKLRWIVSVPDNLEVRGQITGSNGADFRRKDQLVMYADDGEKLAKVFSIH